MAAGEDQAQRVVADLLAFVPARGTVGNGLDAIGDVALERLEAGASPDAVDRLEAAGRDQPRHRIRGNAVARPLLDGGLERVLHRLFGEIEVAEQADQGRQDLARVAPVERGHDRADLRRRRPRSRRSWRLDRSASRSDAGAQHANEGDRAGEEDERGPERIRDADQADRGVGAAGARLEHVGQEAVELGRVDDLVGEREVARGRARGDEVLPERGGDAGEREQQAEPGRDPAAGRVRARPGRAGRRGRWRERSAAAARTRGTAPSRTRAARPARRRPRRTRAGRRRRTGP